MTRLLLFGAGGFLGRHVATALAAAAPYFEVWNVGRGAPVPLADSDAGRWRRLDLVNAHEQSYRRLLELVKPEVVINCAGAVTGTAAELYLANVVIPARLAEAAVTRNDLLRVVQLGSAAEYGPISERTPVGEDHSCRPISPYGATKLAATRLLLAAGACEQLEVVVLRVFNPIGAAPHTLAGRVVRDLHRAIVSGSTCIRLGRLDSYRDVVDARDVGRAVALAATKPGLRGEVVNVAGGRAVQVRDVVWELVRLSGYAGEVEEDGYGSPRSGVVDWQRADIRKAAARLGWSPMSPLASSLEALWRSSIAEAADGTACLQRSQKGTPA